MYEWTVVQRGRPRFAPQKYMKGPKNFPMPQRQTRQRGGHYYGPRFPGPVNKNPVSLQNRFQVLQRKQSGSRSRSAGPPRRNMQYHGQQPLNRHKPLQQTNFTPPSEKDRRIIKHIFNLIRSVHHLGKIDPTKDLSHLPPSLQHLGELISTMIQPASPSDRTTLLLEGNAKNWLYTTTLILEEHYTCSINQLSNTIKDEIEGDWEKYFETATRWAFRTLGKRLENDSLKKTREILKALFPDPVNNRDQDRVIMEIVPQITSDEGLASTSTQTLNLQSIEEFPPLPKRDATTSPISNNEWESSPVEPPKPPRSKQKKPCVINFDQEGLQTIAPASHFQLTPIYKKSNQVERGTDPEVTVHEQPSGSLLDSPPEPEILISLLNDFLDPQESPPPLQSSPVIPQIEGAKLSSSGTQQKKSPKDSRTEIQTREWWKRNTSKFRPTKHLATSRKLQHWTLSVSKKFLIIGDSNLSRIGDFDFQDLQIDSYPGATFRHAEALLSKSTSTTNVERVILAFGINHKSQDASKTAIKQLQLAVNRAHEAFIGAQIFVPIINYSKNLRLSEMQTLWKMNEYIKNNVNHIPKLPSKYFNTGDDNIHWTADTAQHMLAHWLSHASLN